MVDEILLPYRSDWREMRSVLDYGKGKGADRGALEARFGAGESLRETLNALEQLGLIERSDGGDIRLTQLGDAIIWAPDTETMRDRLIDALVTYPPYRYPIERAAAGEIAVIDGPWVEHIWQVDMRLGQPRNRVEEARTFFFRLADDAGLGTYRRGVRGQTTRLDLAEGFVARVRPALERLNAAVVAAAPDRDPEPVPASPATPVSQSQAGAGTPPVAITTAPESRATPDPALATTPTAASPAPSLSIHVDMSEWELERIEAFLRMIGYPLVQTGSEG